MRYLRLQRSQANRRRAEREAERAALQSRSQPAQGAPAQTMPLSQRLQHKLAGEHGVQLSPRQAEVALYILRGHSSQSIGKALGISGQTVKVFRRQLYAKCAVSSQAQLFALLLPLLTGLTESH